MLVEPDGYLVGIEADEAPDFDVRDAPLRNEPADVAVRDTELFGELVDVEEPGECVDVRHVDLRSFASEFSCTP